MKTKAKKFKPAKMQGQLFQLPINPRKPLMMHIDMNSCFATVEQQANPLLRGRPIAVSPYTSPRGIIIAPSVEAKELGIKLGMRNQEAKQICPDIVILPPDPPKYRDAHLRFKRIFQRYTSAVAPKSIDEAVIDFEGSQAVKTKHILDIGQDIKRQIKRDIGEWMRVSIGVGTNRFLAKTAAGINKPDGLEIVDGSNLLDTYNQLELIDLTGINTRFEARLNANGIFSPLQFFDAPLMQLKKEVFQSIVGYYWYLRLRGWEIDNVEFGRKSFGHTYALGKKTADKQELSRLLLKLCEKVGRRLRRNDYYATGVNVSFFYEDRTGWNRSKKVKTRLYATKDIYLQSVRLMNMQPTSKVVTNIAITAYGIHPYKPEQLGLFDGTRADKDNFYRQLDAINDRYGEFTVRPATLMDMDGTIVDRIAFGGIRDLEMFYEEDDLQRSEIE